MVADTGNATYLEAVGLALDAEMDRDPDVFLIGEDVGQFGGAFKVTKGFLDKFGPRRVVDTPIAETGFTGLAIGVSTTRRGPNLSRKPFVTLNAPPNWPTSSPIRKTSGSR